MIRTIYAVARYWLRPTVKSWRALRVTLMARLPKQERKENGDHL